MIPPGDDRPRHPGTQSLLTNEVKRKLVENLHTGVPIHVAAQAAGVTGSTYQSWMQVARKAATKQERGETLTIYEEQTLALSHEAQRAFDEVHMLLAGRVVAASADDWKAATWMLQRRHPEVWGLGDRVEVMGLNGGPISIEEVEERVLETIAVAALEHPSGNGASEDR